MRHTHVVAAALVLLVTPLVALAEVSVVIAPDGRALRFLKLADPGRRIVWQPVSEGDAGLSRLNPAGDARGDLAPIAMFHAPRVSPSPVDVVSMPAEGERELIVVRPDTGVVSRALPLTPDLDLCVIWSRMEKAGFRLVWSRWLWHEVRWSTPKRITTYPAAGHEVEPRVVEDRSGRLTLLWREEGKRPLVWGARWIGDGWSLPFILTDGEKTHDPAQRP